VSRGVSPSKIEIHTDRCTHRHRRAAASTRYPEFQSIWAASLAPYGLNAPASTFPPIRPALRQVRGAGPRGLRPAASRRQTNLAPRSSPTLGFTLRVPSESTCHVSAARKRANETRRLFHEVPFPTTLPEVSSDLHQAYRAWLCCALGLSQTLDALFRSRPLRPCFIPVTPLGFRLQRLPLSSSRPCLSALPAPLAISPRFPTPTEVCTDPRDRGFRGSSIRRVRTRPKSRFPATWRPILS